MNEVATAVTIFVYGAFAYFLGRWSGYHSGYSRGRSSAFQEASLKVLEQMKEGDSS